MNPEQEYNVTEDQKQQYRRDGQVLLTGVGRREEIDAVRREILDVVEVVSASGDKQGKISDYGKMFTQVTNVWSKNEIVRKFVFAKRFAKIAADLMGVKAVRLYHDQALIKEPGGKATPWHQDYYYWPLETEHTITMWMALVDITREMGSMSFVSGSHASGSFQTLPISDTSQEYFERMIEQQKLKSVSYELKAGDATFHSGRLLHAAHANRSDRRREVMTIIYYADGTRLMHPDNEHRAVDMKVFLPGQSPGEPAASSLNPILFP